MTASTARSHDAALREQLVAASRELTRRGLSPGRSGNISVRCDAQHFIVTPTGMEYELLEPADMVRMDLGGHWFGRRRPSSEWRFHRDIFRTRPDAHAVVHTHSLNATALACTGRGIPAFHYMVAAGGGEDIRCAPYRTFGSQELSEAALAALEGRRACLLGNHGLLALGPDLGAALNLAAEVENLAAQYRLALSMGQVRLLEGEEMARVVEKFRTYGQQDSSDAGLVFAGEEPYGD